MNDRPETQIGYVTPLKKICMTIGELPTAYIETMSYYEMLIWFVEFLRNQVIPVVNNNSGATEELQTLFVELQNYVNNYFDNLDVQEEINNKIDAMVESGEFEEIVGDYLKNKLTYYLIDNTFSFNDIQEIFNKEESKVIEFKNGNYTFNDTFMLNKNTKIILNNANLTFTTPHAFYNFLGTDEFLSYNGNGNIEIIGGTITGGTIRFCHAKNILIKNVKFINSLAGHILEMASISDLHVENCEFNGQTTTEYWGEVIQIDDMTYSNFPWFDEETNPTYDNTPNSNWNIINNKFKVLDGYSFHTGIGSHTYIENVYHENINIIDNEFIGFDFSCVRFFNVKNANVINNIMETGINVNETNYLNVIVLRRGLCENINIENNTIKGNTNASVRAIVINTPNSYKNVRIRNNSISDIHANIPIDNQDEITTIALFDGFCEISGNHFSNISMRLLSTIPNTSISNGEIIFKNNFVENYTYTNMMFNLQTGKKLVFLNNTFNVTSGNCFKLDARVEDIIIKDNNISDYLLANRCLSPNGYLGSYANIYGIPLRVYNGQSASLTNQTLDYDYKQFNKMIITFGSTSGGVSSGEIKPLVYFNKLVTGKYLLWTATSSSAGIASISLNDTGTLTYTNTITLNIRTIILINE